MCYVSNTTAAVGNLEIYMSHVFLLSFFNTRKIKT